jgi:hypothetical protein
MQLLCNSQLRCGIRARSTAEKSGGDVVEFLGDVWDENDVARFANLVQKQWGRAFLFSRSL